MAKPEKPPEKKGYAPEREAEEVSLIFGGAATYVEKEKKLIREGLGDWGKEISELPFGTDTEWWTARDFKCAVCQRERKCYEIKTGVEDIKKIKDPELVKSSINRLQRRIEKLSGPDNVLKEYLMGKLK